MAIDKSKVNIPLIGLLAVKNLFITKEELQKALSKCLGAKDLNIALKEYFISKQLVSSQNIARLVKAAKALEMRQLELKFGVIAIKNGFINQGVLKLVLEEQKVDIKNKKKMRLIGDMLVEAGMLTVKQRDSILKLQKRIKQDPVPEGSPKNVPDSKKTPPAQETVIEKEATNKETNQEGSPVQAVETQEGEATQDIQKADGSSKELVDEKEEDQSLVETEIITGGIKLEIAKDWMAAFLSKSDHFANTVTVDEVKEALYEKDIVFGLANDKMIEGFINSSGFKTKSFRIAKGIIPIQGKDARVEFFFNTDYLKAGGLTKDGVIDFKDRGEVPHVEEGTMLAEKIPMVESRTGHNIYGQEIDAIPGEDIALKCGKGSKLSEDGYKILAAVKGFPKYTLSGHVYVHQSYTTSGDVDYQTGHINYDGNVVVTGRIKSGFKVKGNDISAIELDGGILNADGDVKIAGGINEGKIYARGNVYAKFIHKSEIVCMGDVIVEKEIVEADVECSGSCVVENGKLITSNVTAKMGVHAMHIGTQMSAPNIIKVAHDPFTEKELEKNKVQLDALKEKIEHQDEKKEKFKEENLTVQKQITELAHVQDRSQLEEKEINSKLASMEKSTQNAAVISELQEKVKKLQSHAQMAEKSLDGCFDKSDEIEELTGAVEKEINSLSKRRGDFLEERKNLIQWAKDNPGKPVVVVKGAAMSETIIRGMHSEKRLSEMVRHAKIMEVLCTSEDGQSLNLYEMQVGNI
jgi:uncharacterized protein (DUF342 family)